MERLGKTRKCYQRQRNEHSQGYEALGPIQTPLNSTAEPN